MDRFGQWLEKRRRGAAFGAALLALFSIAATSPASSEPSGKFLGVISGLTLLAIVCYAIYDYMWPVFDENRSTMTFILIALALFSIIKLILLNFNPGFGVDVGDYQAWGDQMWSSGPAQMYKPGYFIDYPPGYIYALWFAASFAHAIGATGDFFRPIIESPAIIADFALTVLMYVFVARGERSKETYLGVAAPLIAMLAVALNPAMFYDTVIWGQTDSVMSFIMLLSLGLIIARQFELSWALAAIGVLIKPQALILLPVLGLWTLLETEYRTWIRSGVIAIAVAMIGIGPYQIGHEWLWIFKLYQSTAAYYHETSVNAFNLLALIGGVRAQDSETIAGISYYALGMGLLVPLYAYIAWILIRGRTATRLVYCSFLAIFGFFMVAPRMHERYLYTAIPLVVPLMFEAPEMLAIFILLTLTCWFNLGYVLHALSSNVFLDRHDGLAMADSVLNFAALIVTIYYGATRLELAPEGGFELAPLFKKMLAGRATGEAGAIPMEAEPQAAAPPPWERIDTYILSALLAFAAFFRFWRIGDPPEIVFDETHFVKFAKDYLHGEYFMDPHPPLAKLVNAFGIALFGDHPWSWRIGNALVGTALVAITYLLGRRMVKSRLTGTLAASIIA
ncbi:MAG TPA: phospholipid carrier-dependent glycosyltransferase, partial [Candidatus Binataceae bacterium]|nr:phospholipid carrier-dependent glycosyltransferase [Candidatus Binataceae bacterium]